jgi:hypothetical protein
MYVSTVPVRGKSRVYGNSALSCNPMELGLWIDYYFCDDAISILYVEWCTPRHVYSPYVGGIYMYSVPVRGKSRVYGNSALSCNPMELGLCIDYYFCDDAISIFYLE